MINQVMIKTSKLYNVLYDDYTKCPGNGELNKKIIKCACHAHVKTGANENVENFISFLYSINMYTFCNYETLTTVFEYITKDKKTQNDILDFLSTFLVELTTIDLTIDLLKEIITKSLKEFTLNGINRINDRLKDYLDNNHILVNNQFDCMITLLFILKAESYDIYKVLTEN